MFHLASSLYTQYTKREQYNVLILGLDNAGKTTFLEHIKLLYSSPESSKNAPINEAHASEENNTTSKVLKSKRILPTVGQNTTTVKYEAARDSTLSKSYNNINLKFWDLGGQQSLRSMWSRYYRQCHGIIFVIDSTDTARFQECYDTLMEISHNPSWAAAGSEEDGEGSTSSEAQEHLMSQQDEATVNVPILMMANKQDLPEAVDLVSLKTGVFIQVVSELEATDLKLLPVSVLENQGLKESLEWLVTRLVYNKSNKMPEYR